MPSTNTDKLKGQRLGHQKVIERLIERLEENDKLQFEPTIVAIKNQLEVIRALNEKIIALSDVESTPDELLDSQMYVFDMEAKLRRYRQNLRDHPSSSSTAVHDSSLSMSVLQPTESSNTRYRSVEEEPHASLQLPTLPTSSENVNQSSLPAFHQPRQVSTTIADTNVMQPAQQNVKHPTSGDTNTHNKPSPSESSNRSGAAHSRSRGRNKEQDARSTPQNMSEAMGGSGQPEKSTRESQSNIETVESCKTLRRDAESEPVAILKACAILQASSRSVGLSGVPRTPRMFSADYPKDPGLSLSRTRNGSYTTSDGIPQKHGVSLDNIPKPSVSSNRTPDGPIVSLNKTPQNPGILSDHSQREIKKLSDYWSRQSPLAESSPRLRSNRKSLFNIKECLGKSSKSTPVRKRSRSHDCPEQTGNLKSKNLPESPFPSTSSDSKSPSSRNGHKPTIQKIRRHRKRSVQASFQRLHAITSF